MDSGDDGAVQSVPVGVSAEGDEGSGLQAGKASQLTPGWGGDDGQCCQEEFYQAEQWDYEAVGHHCHEGGEGGLGGWDWEVEGETPEYKSKMVKMVNCVQVEE